MFTIKRKDMENATKQPDAKTKFASTDSTIYDSFKLSIWNMIDTLKDLSVYDMAQWINHIDRWIKNKNMENTKKYGRGCIVFVDLGAQNFRYEPSYTHPAVIIAETKNMVLIVPCSSKRYGKRNSGIIDATSADGFSSNTGVQVDSFRWVHKNRIISEVGRAKGSVLDKIDSYILSITPSYKKEKSELNAEIERLKKQIADLTKTE
ncbi:MAG: type II toxin-antitoxin system PemK/MazF family toxin [Oscillospiraceae bacterium]|nr:type II toxin-antitoxin system PemK/MazF family toxin [Oscillospiraceae bacterium]